MKKNKKIILRIFLIALALCVFSMLTNKSYGVIEILGVVGFGAVIIWAIQLCVIAFATIGQGIMAGLTAMANGADTAVSGLKSIFFNENSLTTASYFATDKNRLGLSNNAIWTSDNIMANISANISKYYFILRNLSIAILLFILLYIGIRMAISTVASDEAKYKKMLKNWAISLALVFVLHYIMIITFYINNTLVSILSEFANTGFKDYRVIAQQGCIPIFGIGEAIVYAMIIGMELTFLFMYIKRIIILGFLIIIAPLITITYSIDKIGDGRSQALNTWLKEFIFNVIIQPFHCIIYIVLIQSVIQSVKEWSARQLHNIYNNIAIC